MYTHNPVSGPTGQQALRLQPRAVSAPLRMGRQQTDCVRVALCLPLLNDGTPCLARDAAIQWSCMGGLGKPWL